MRYVLMVSHGDFAEGLHSAVKMMTGERDDVLSIGLKDGMGTPEFAEKLKAIVSTLEVEDEIVLLADILSGSPFTTSLQVLDEAGFMDKTVVFAGMNMPLAITAVLMKDNMDLESLKTTLVSEGKEGLLVYEPVIETDDNEDDI